MKWAKSYQGVTAFCGMPGSGKTYGLVQRGLAAYQAGTPVYCNEGFDVDFCTRHDRVFTSFEDFLAIPNGSLVIWDELPLYVNSRKWQEFPDGLLYRLTQIRKDGLRLYYSAIHESMIDVTVRRLTFWYWNCRAVSGRLLVRSLWPPEAFRKVRQKSYRREWLWVNDDVAAHYDTLAKVAAPLTVSKTTQREAVRWSKPVVGNGVVPAPSSSVRRTVGLDVLPRRGGASSAVVNQGRSG